MTEVHSEAGMELPKKGESHGSETNYETLEAAIDAEPKLEVEAMPIDKSFKASNPFQWLKWTFPRILFTALMIAETVDIISDCLQLQEVVEKFGKYAAPPFVPAVSLDKRYTVIWEKVDRVGTTNESMLGYTLAWEGNPSGANVIEMGSASFFELDCLANGELEGSGHKIFTNEVRPSARGSEYTSEEICIPLRDVFSYSFPAPFPRFVSGATALCPNNETAIFDEKSFLLAQNFSDGSVTSLSDNFVDNGDCETYGCGKDLYVISETKEPVNMLNYYKPDWVAEILSVTQCSTLYAIYISTIIFFSFSAACIALQVVQFSARFRRVPPGATDEEALREFKKERVQALVEFPMIGFLLAYIYLDEEGWDIYAEIDYYYGQNHPEYLLISRILGFHDRNNLLHVPIWPYYQVKGEANPPRSVTLGQKLFHFFCYPLSSGFKKVMIGEGCIRYLWLAVYYCVFPGICAWCLAWFCSVSIPMILIVLAYSDKLLLGRILFDVPNFCLALSYIVIIESNAASILSVLFSGFFIAYYLSGILYQVFMDAVRTPPPEIFPIDNLYGNVTGRGEALYQAFVMPIIEICQFWIIFPGAFFRNSLIRASPDDDGSTSKSTPCAIIHLICVAIGMVGICLALSIFVATIMATFRDE